MTTGRYKILLAGAALVFTVLWFALLPGRPLYDPDEGRYAEIPREMLQGGDWVIPHLNGLAYLEKPPLQYWLTALSFQSFGESEGAARLWTGLCGYLSLAVVFFIGRRLWGFGAGLAALMLTAASTLFVLLGHQLTLDMSLNFWLLLSLAGFISAQLQREDRRACRAWMLGCWAAMAFAVLTKGLVGVLIPGATLALYVAWQRDTKVFSRLNIGWGLPLFAAIALPWFVLAARANPAFLRFFFIREHLQRYLTPIEHRTEPVWFFIPVLIVGVLPWLPQALRAIASGWRASAPRGEFDPVRLLWIWSVFVLVFFSLSDSKLIPYILPAVPALALLCSRPGAHRDDRASLIAGALLSVAAGAGVVAYASAVWSSPGGRDLAVELRPILIATSGLLGIAAIACAFLVFRKRPHGALAVLCAGWFLAALTILIGAGAAQRFFSAKNIADTLRRVAPVDAAVPIFSVQTYEQSLPFYLQRTVILVDYRDEFALGLSQDPSRGIATLDEFVSRWRALSEGIAVMPYATRYRLSAKGVPMRELARFPAQVLVSRR
jgi:4-amino-4-deoxy-L-arabinose transferase-like glycosyltransferase